MSQLIDSGICPDCRAALDTEGTCTGCGLTLRGPLAAELWTTMVAADTLVERLRVAPSTAQPPARGPLPRAPLAPPVPHRPIRTLRQGRLSAASVPTVLFGVGALCLLVAAVVFVAVAWSSLGLGARTSILLAVTAGFAALAARLTLRGLRGAAETFWLVVGALVAIDLVAAYSAGLVGFDHLAGRHAVAVLGSGLLGLGLAVGTWVRRTELAALASSTVLSAAGALLLAASEGWAAPSTAGGATVAVLALAALALGAGRLGLRHTSYAVQAVAVLSWVVLVGAGLDRAAEVGVTSWWTGLAGWPLLVAAVIAAGPALVPAVPEALRTAAAAASELALVLLVVLPGAAADVELVVACIVVVTLAGASLVLPRTWAVPAACFAGIGGLAAAGDVLLRPFGALAGLPTTAPTNASNLGLRLTPADAAFSPWTAIVVGAVVVLVALAATRWVADPALLDRARRGWLVGAPTLLALVLATAFLETAPTLAPAVLAWSGVLAVLAVLATGVRQPPAPAVLLGAGYLAVVGLRLAVPSHLLAALLASALAAGLWAGHRRATGTATRAVAGAAAVVAAGFAATHWPFLFGGSGDAAGLALAVLASAVGLTAAWAPRPVDRVVLEGTALALGLGAAAFPVDVTITTLVLTLVGSAVALVAVLHRDRDDVAWLGTAILAAAALLRVVHHLTVPELATAPAAALLLLAGVRRMRTDTTASSLRVLGSGLTLALGPSLLVSIDEPVSVRAAVLGAAALLALSVGIGQRWAAPFLAGAGVVAMLAVRHLGPVADGLPRWISLGAVGALLLAVAITWESRRRQLEVAERYLAALR